MERKLEVQDAEIERAIAIRIQIQEEIEELDLVDKIAFVQKKLAGVDDNILLCSVDAELHQYLAQARVMLNELKDDYRAEIEAIERRAELAEKANKIVTLADDDTSEDNPAKRGLSRQLAMMLLDELFPNLENASNTAKADFLELLTGFSSDGLRNKWSDYRRGNTESVNADMEKVAEWKRKLKISD